MNGFLLAGFGTFVTFLALGGFSVWQLGKTEAQAHGPAAGVPATAGPSPTEDVPRAA